MAEPTKTDPIKHEWAITDGIMRLREWATDRSYLLPEGCGEVRMGSSEDCEIRLTDPSGLLSRVHAKIAGDGTTWAIHDLSKNGIKLDGAVCPSFVLESGCVISVGRLTLIAESGRSIALRALLARMLGWTSDRDEAVDLALQSVRMAATRRAPLNLSSESDPVSLAYQIHRVAIGAERPFISCDPKRKSTSESVRSVRNIESGMEALDAAAGGSLCLWSSRLPSDFAAVRSALRDPEMRVQLVIVSNHPAKAIGDEPVLPPPIVVPSLSSRAKELSMIVDQYADDARREFGAEREHFKQADRAWVVEYASSNLAEIETAATRIVALRFFGNVNRAAEHLGMAHVSLARWIERRNVPWRT